MKIPSPSRMQCCLLALSIVLPLHVARATTTTVHVGAGGGTTFSPDPVFIEPGDTVEWVWDASGHSVTSGTPSTPSTPDGMFDTGLQSVGFIFSHTFPTAGSFPYFCTRHGAMMTGTVNVEVSTPTPTPAPTVTPIPTPTATATAAATPCGPFNGEYFDGVVAPALPPGGWVASNAAGPAPVWVTSTVTPDTAPNDVFIDDPAVVSDKRLETPSILIQSALAQLSFRNYYDLESGLDGGVLEMSINGGAFADITDGAAGASFITGGYDATISTAFSSPIGGRMAWSGNSGGYTSTVVNLGPNVNGQFIKLRFRMASDNGGSAPGWRVDTMLIAQCNSTPHPSPAPPTPTPTPALVSISGTVTYCSNPIGANPVAGATITLTGGPGGSTLTDGSGAFTLTSLPAGLNYTVTPTKANRVPGSAGINTVDVLAVQKHFLNIPPALTACHLTAADVNGVGGVNTVDVIAVQKFFLNNPGTANVGQYQFAPASRFYTPLIIDQTGQDFAALIFGDVIATFADRVAGEPSEDEAEIPASEATADDTDDPPLPGAGYGVAGTDGIREGR